jgi:polysaccharide deacetylase 2 family uncharacterized protein YibQ
MKSIIGLCLLILTTITIAWMVHRHLRPEPPETGPPFIGPRPTYEIYPAEKTLQSAKGVRRPVPKIPRQLSIESPRVAIIIDDVGYERAVTYKLMDLQAPLTFSVLPYSPFQRRIVERAHQKGFEIMLHLPMEPQEYPEVDPGPGALLTTMPPGQLGVQLNRNLNAVAHVRGVNNHMGSKMTEHSDQMCQILSVLKKRDLYFIDSLTSSGSICETSARSLNIRFAERDIFLDHVQTAENIRRQIERLIRIAERYGEALGIGHPHRETYEVLRLMLPEMRERVRLVPASQLVHPLG